MIRKQIALEAYQAGHTSREAAHIAGLSPNYVRALIGMAGISRPVGRPRKQTQGTGGCPTSAAGNFPGNPACSPNNSASATSRRANR